jgi:MFS family permease
MIDSTKFPLGKLLVISSISLINSASYLMTYPFVAFMIQSFSELGELRPTDIGFYSGILEGSYHVGAFIGAILWGSLSDMYGRRITLLSGLIGTVIASLLFGFSTNFAMAIFARFAWGALNGNVGIAKTVLSEITADKFTARAFSFLGIATGFGRLIGPAVGGFLAEPARKYSAYFPNDGLFGKYPYALPCVVAAGCTLLVTFAAYMLLEETLQLSIEEQKSLDKKNSVADFQQLSNSEKQTEQGEIENDDTIEDDIDEAGKLIQESNKKDEKVVLDKRGNKKQQIVLSKSPLTKFSVRKFFSSFGFGLLKDYAIGTTILLYTLLGVFGLVSNELFPLYVLNDKNHGGFSFETNEIGLVATLAGPPLILFQAFVYDRLVSRFGLIRLFRLSLCSFAIAMITTPMCSWALDNSSSLFQWSVVVAHFSLTTIVRVCSFTCVFVFVANSALPKDRGKVNGISQACVSVSRAIGPPIFTALFAWSSARDDWPFNYYFAWYLMGIGSFITLWVSYSLPHWIETKRTSK